MLRAIHYQGFVGGAGLGARVFLGDDNVGRRLDALGAVAIRVNVHGERFVGADGDTFGFFQRGFVFVFDVINHAPNGGGRIRDDVRRAATVARREPSEVEPEAGKPGLEQKPRRRTAFPHPCLVHV